LLSSTNPDVNIEYIYTKIIYKYQVTQNSLYFQRFTHIEDLHIICFNVFQATQNIKEVHYWMAISASQQTLAPFHQEERA